jgi:hypothetical protein
MKLRYRNGNGLSPNNSQNQAATRGRTVVPEKMFLFTNARDEPSILEWAFHHLLLGFSHVFIYDHLSVTPITSVMADYLKTHPENKELVDQIAIIRIGIDATLTNQNQTQNKNIKIPLMNSALEYSVAENADWLLYLDTDEFLTINDATFKEANPVKQLLSLFYFADSLAVNWLMFGSSDHETQPDGLLMQNFVHSDKKLNPHVKTFVRPAYVKRAINPHYYPAIQPSRAFAATGNTMEALSAFNPVEMEFRNAPAYVAHYVVQSKAEFMRRKGRPMDDGTGNKSGMYAQDALHVVHNDCVNKQLKNRHAEAVEALLK